MNDVFPSPNLSSSVSLLYTSIVPIKNGISYIGINTSQSSIYAKVALSLAAEMF